MAIRRHTLYKVCVSSLPASSLRKLIIFNSVNLYVSTVQCPQISKNLIFLGHFNVGLLLQ
jgi:hypothetical protein